MLTYPNTASWIAYNGLFSIPISSSDGQVNPAELLSGVVPALTAPTLDQALVLGLGTGITAGATAQIFDHTDVVELNNAMYKLMPDIASANLDINSSCSGSRARPTRWGT